MKLTNTARAAYIATARRIRTRIGNALSVARRRSVIDAIVTRANQGRWTAAGYLADVLGADADFVRRFASPFGKAAAKAYRDRTGTDPQRDGLARVGYLLVRVFTYDRSDLDTAARAYARTRDLIAA